jgi:hypothetical protein
MTRARGRGVGLDPSISQVDLAWLLLQVFLTLALLSGRPASAGAEAAVGSGADAEPVVVEAVGEGWRVRPHPSAPASVEALGASCAAARWTVQVVFPPEMPHGACRERLASLARGLHGCTLRW